MTGIDERDAATDAPGTRARDEFHVQRGPWVFIRDDLPPRSPWRDLTLIGYGAMMGCAATFLVLIVWANR